MSRANTEKEGAPPSQVEQKLGLTRREEVEA